MADAKLTLFGIEHYLNLDNDTLFTSFNTDLPTGIDESLLKDNIILRGGEFPVLYADADYMKYNIGVWCRKWYRTFDKWVTALAIEYDPLSNYDRHEDWEDLSAGTRSTTDQGSRSTDDQTARSTTDQSSRSGSTEDAGSILKTNADNSSKTVDGTSSGVSDGTGNQTETNKRSAYNSGTFENDTQSITDNTTESLSATTSNTRETGSGTGTETSADSRTGSHSENEDRNTSETDIRNTSETDSRNASETSSDSATRKGRAWGNIGILTSQAMLEAELDIAQWNLYEHITDMFLEEFTIPIYI